jgi:hypothetical protein
MHSITVTQKVHFRNVLPTKLSSVSNLIRCNHTVDPVTNVTDFLNGISRDTYQTLKPKMFGNPILMNDLQQAVTAFKTAMQNVYKYPNDQKKQHDKNFRSIGAADRTDDNSGRGGHSGRFGGRSFSEKSGRYGSNRGHGNRGCFNKGGRGGSGRNQGNRNKRPFEPANTSGNDNLYIPPDVLNGLNSIQRAMILCGRDDMRQNASNTNTNVP